LTTAKASCDAATEKFFTRQRFKIEVEKATNDGIELEKLVNGRAEFEELSKVSTSTLTISRKRTLFKGLDDLNKSSGLLQKTSPASPRTSKKRNVLLDHVRILDEHKLSSPKT
jgi:hypothetical protein